MRDEHADGHVEELALLQDRELCGRRPDDDEQHRHGKRRRKTSGTLWRTSRVRMSGGRTGPACPAATQNSEYAVSPSAIKASTSSGFADSVARTRFMRLARLGSSWELGYGRSVEVMPSLLPAARWGTAIGMSRWRYPGIGRLVDRASNVAAKSRRRSDDAFRCPCRLQRSRISRSEPQQGTGRR